MKNPRILRRTRLGQSTEIPERTANQKSLWDGYGLEKSFPRMSHGGLRQQLVEKYKDSEKEKTTVSSRFPDVRISSSIAQVTRRIQYRIQPKLAKRLA